MASPPRRRVLPPPLPDDLVEEILLRLPPDDPACLLRASLVCKDWAGIVSHAAFRRRLHELHRAAPVLGFLHDWEDERIPRFIPTTASFFSLPAPEWRSWRAIDCRHGRALLLSKGSGARELLVWEPITGAQQRVPVPAAAFESDMPAAAVFCAADGCNHHNCLGGPFCVAFLFGLIFFTDDSDREQFVTSACVYSSETGAWGELTSLPGQFGNFEYYSSVLVRRSLLYFMSDAMSIQEYDLARHSLAVFSPPNGGDFGDGQRINLMLAEDGGLGVSEGLVQHLKLWSRVVGDGADDRWVLSRVINLKILLPNDALVDATSSVQVLGYAEEANVIFVNTDAGLFSIELQSERASRVCDDHDVCNLIPVVSFYTPHSPLERAQELFNKGCKAVEERDFTNAINCFRHALKIRVQHYGELAPECASTFYRYGRAKALQAANPSKRAPNEESVKIAPTTNKDDAGSSKASGSSVEHVPPARKGDSEEGANLNGKDLEDANTTADGDDSDLDLAWKMLDTARAIVAKSPDQTMEKVNIFCALAQVSTKTGDRDNTIGYYLKALAMLEHLVRPDHPRIIKINVHIFVAFELASKVGDAIPYCAKAISVCKSRIQNLKHAKEALFTSAAEGSSGKFTPEEEIAFLTRFLARLQKKLEKLELAMSAPSSCTDKTMKRALSLASHEQNVSSTAARAASSTSQMAGSNNSSRSPTMSTEATTGGIGSGVTDLRIVSTGMEHTNDKPISDEPSPKRFAADDSPFVK
ncbi:uncharacterized protein LOC119306656 [Triticum dicoccoides]|uniref:uncharacterized protein LOC119306656 n=1 Tax=Triticum dicoccoides TaxID=85692 RepID=UPI00188DDD2C|nr:uncharacterized protein LOC119306656 [Triticum dicoccoides]